MIELFNRLAVFPVKRSALQSVFALAACLCAIMLQSATAQDTSERHGVIEIGSSGVKVQAYDLSRTEAQEALTSPDAADGLRYHVFAERSLTEHDELDVNPYRPENVERTADAVKYFIDYLYAEYGVGREHTYHRRLKRCWPPGARQRDR